jgi:hypothetical protein
MSLAGLGLLLAQIIGPAVSWPSASGAAKYRVWVCPTTCAVTYYSVNGTVKPFPSDQSQWRLLDEVPKRTRKYPIVCGYAYSVQAVAKGGNTSALGNIVRCP